jgi:hypothetical protein
MMNARPLIFSVLSCILACTCTFLGGQIAQAFGRSFRSFVDQREGHAVPKDRLVLINEFRSVERRFSRGPILKVDRQLPH